MKIYFSASISQKKGLEDYYVRINKVLSRGDNQVFSGNLFKNDNYKEDVKDQKAREKWYKQAVKDIVTADVVVVEISSSNSFRLVTSFLSVFACIRIVNIPRNINNKNRLIFVIFNVGFFI